MALDVALDVALGAASTMGPVARKARILAMGKSELETRMVKHLFKS
jgi:hypothetical protein